MSSRKIGILTGGGDVPGLNCVIKEVVERGADNGWDTVGIRRGWEGLTHLNIEDPASKGRYVMPLDRASVRTIDRTGGTVLHSSRTNPSKMKKVASFLSADSFPKRESSKGTTYDVSKHVISNLEKLGIDYLIAIGGDDTLSYAARLHELGVKVLAVPKTMDNDVRNTEYCIGFSTAITRAMDAIQRQRSTVGSHERVGIFRIFGRDAGFTALYTAYVTFIKCCIPEYTFNVDQLIDQLMQEKRDSAAKYSLVVLSEGAKWENYVVEEYGEADAFGHRHKASIGEALAEQVTKKTGEETIVSDLTYDLRSGSPDFVDKLVATTFGSMAMDALFAGKSGLMAAIEHGCYTMASIPDPALGPLRVDLNTMYDAKHFRPNYENKLGLPVFLNRATN
jgi:6-phosphofructokinase 1